MDLQLEQWRNQHESEPQQHSPSMPKFLLQHPPPPASLTLPLFLPQPYPIVTTLTLPSALPRFIRMESCFSFAQWQELELQALIFRYMLAGVPVPPQLLHPIKKSLFHSSLPFLQHYHPALFESGYYWERDPEEDPEPGRCRRTDGKKWRCSREAVEGQKYCERHMHRGRNRSRKPVEKPHASSSSPSATFKHHFLHLNQSSSGGKSESRNSSKNHDHDWDDRSSGHVLRHFFDDWPRTVQEPDHGERNDSQNNNTGTGTGLSMSTPGITSSDVSLKLFTGHAEEEDTCHVTSVGGPLAEALRSSTSTPSPTSVLLQLPTSSACETSLITT